ncbi:MAG TPA: hypothetical protein VFQ53_01505 [Kofleriaceae bacterium]|nr:hypothetical protein [Kofleriaceae bacterium]
MKSIVFAVLLGLLGATVVHAQPTSEAEALYVAGQKAYDAKRYDDALVSWQRSYELSRLPGLLFNIAQAHRLRGKPGDCTKAIARYHEFVKLDPKSAQRAKAEGFIIDLAPCAASEAAAASPSPTAPPPPSTASGAPAEPAPPPVVHDAPASPGRTKRIASYVAGGTGVVLLGTGLYFGNKASSLGKEVTAACADGCDFANVAAKDAEGRSAAKKQWVFYGLGAGALATSGVLYWLASKEHAPNVAIAPHGTGAVVSWSGRW